jgi:ribonucleotide reductase beta subunit family protein with ferritin-like domain
MTDTLASQKVEYVPVWKAERATLVPEPLTLNPERRWCLKPILHADLYDNYEKQMARFWTFHEVDHSTDATSWATLNKDEQHYIAMNMALFANSDNGVMENLATRFRTEITWPEAQLALGYQGMMEGIHVVTYNNMIDSVIPDPAEKIKLFHAVNREPIVEEVMHWLTKWAGDPETPLHVCIFAQCLAEGVIFAPGFASFLFLRYNQKCPGICFGNEKIIEDESLHVKLFALLYSHCSNKLCRADVEAMTEELVEIQDRFIAFSLPYRLKGMNAELMSTYVRKVADSVLVLTGEQALYHVENPLPYMENMGLLSKANFFEKRVAEYVLMAAEDQIRTAKFDALGDSLDF